MRRPFDNDIERATPDRKFTEGDAQQAIKPTKVSEELLNVLFDEFSHAIEFTGETLDDTGTDTEQFRRAIQWITGEGYRVGSHWIESPDIIDPSPAWPWFRLSQPSGIVPETLWPLYVPYLRERKLNAGSLDVFPGSVQANGFEATYTLSATAESTELLRQLDAYLAQHGSFANWFSLHQLGDTGAILAGDYSITGLDSVARTIKTASNVTVAPSPVSISIYPHRVPGRTDRARHYQEPDVVTADQNNQGVNSALHKYAFGLRYIDGPGFPDTAAVTVTNAGYRRSRVEVSATNAETYQLYVRAAQAPTEAVFDQQVALSGPGPAVWEHMGLQDGETYYYMAVAQTTTGDGPASVPVSWTEADEVLATYSVPGSYDFIPPPGITRGLAITVGGGGQGGGGGSNSFPALPTFTLFSGGPGGGGGSGALDSGEHDLTPGVPVPVVVGGGGSALGQPSIAYFSSPAGGQKGGASSFASQTSPGGAGGGGGKATADPVYEGGPGEDSPPFAGGAGGVRILPTMQGGGGGAGANPGVGDLDGGPGAPNASSTPPYPGGAGGASAFEGFGAGGAGGQSGYNVAVGTPPDLNGTAGEAGLHGLVRVVG